MKIVTFLLVLVSVGLFVSAEEPSWIQPLTSRAAMRSFLVERSVQGYVDIYGGGVIETSDNSLEVRGSSAEELVAKIASRELDFRVVNGREDQVHQAVQFCDQDWNPTFSGWKQLQLVRIKDGGIWVPDPGIVIRMGESVSIPIPSDVSWANIRTMDGEYRVGGADCSIFERNYQSYLNVPTNALGDAFAPGLHGELVVGRQTEGGYVTELYNLSTGQYVTTTDVSMTTDVQIEGVKVLPVDSTIAEVLESEDGIGVNTVFSLTLTRETSLVPLAKTTEGERPIGCLVKTVADGYIEYTPFSAVVTLPAGRYHIWFVWSSFHEEGERGPGWDDYGGKG